MPLITLVLLFKNRNEDKNNKIKKYFLILYQGLTPEAYYWEFVNTLRKVLVLGSLLLPTYLKIGFSSVILILTGRLQIHLKPYKDNNYNEVEFLAILSGTLIILSNLVYLEKDQIDSINNFIMIFIVLVNIIFFVQWIQLLVQMYEEKYKFIKFVIFLLLNF